MIQICPIHYKIESDQVLQIYESNKELIHSKLETAIITCQQRGISVSYKNLYGYIKDNMIRIYSGWILVYENDISETFESASFSETFIHGYQPKKGITLEELERTVLEVFMTGFVIAVEIETKELVCKRKKAVFYEICEAKSLHLRMKRYECGTELFAVRSRWGKVSFQCNYIERKSFTIPSEPYILPNENPVQVFYPGNTENMDEKELDHLMDGIAEQMGKCYSTSEAILKKAEESGYSKNHSVKYYAGWIYSIYAGKLTHHAWIVVDDRHVIDMTARRNSNLNHYIEYAEMGIQKPFSKELLADWFYKEKQENAKFSKYHYCGRVESCIYVGTECTQEEAKQSFALSIKKGLPGYANVVKNGFENELQKIYREKYEPYEVH